MPVLRVLDRQAVGAHGHEAGQVLILRAQPVHHPGADAGTRLHGVAAVHQHQRRLVVGHLGVHRADDRNVVGMGRGLGEDFADLQAALSVLLELERRGERRTGFPLGRQVDRRRLTRVLLERRFRIESVDVRRTAVQEEVDHPLHPAGKVGLLGADVVVDG